MRYFNELLSENKSLIVKDKTKTIKFTILLIINTLQIVIFSIKN